MQNTTHHLNSKHTPKPLLNIGSSNMNHCLLSNTPGFLINSRMISAAQPCYIIAEVGVNHNGKIDLALEHIRQAKASGADAVKFQTFRAENIVVDSAPKADYQISTTGSGSQKEMLKQLELTVDEFRVIRDLCRELSIDFISTAFDSESLAQVLTLDPACLKWPSGEINNVGFLREAALTGKPILLSTGTAQMSEVARAVELCAAERNTSVAILQCVSSYPAAIEDQNLLTLYTMRKAFNLPTGFSDHTNGITVAIGARALGMSVLEKHFTLDKTMHGPDHNASIEPAEFQEMVANIRAIESAFGTGKKQPAASEHEVARVARKSLVYNRKLTKGETLTSQDLTTKRPGTGMPPEFFDYFLGKRLNKDVEQDQFASISDLS